MGRVRPGEAWTLPVGTRAPLKRATPWMTSGKPSSDWIVIWTMIVIRPLTYDPILHPRLRPDARIHGGTCARPIAGAPVKVQQRLATNKGPRFLQTLVFLASVLGLLIRILIPTAAPPAPLAHEYGG
jgi:hypothetical protein